MKIRSIKAAFRFFIAVIVLLSAITLFDIIVEGIIARDMKKLHTFLGYEKAFVKLIVEERMALGDTNHYPQVIELYENLDSGLQQEGYDNDHLTFHRTIYEHLYNNSRDIEQHLQYVRQLLPDLIASVRYIHEHHITYLKNLVRRGRITQDYDVESKFSRSAVKAAPELDIVRMAVAIQNRLLDLFNTFNKVQLGDNPSTLKETFQRQIQDFYEAVNTFEDYSLDAQDGLLVEELLINGRQFENHFRQMLAGEIQIRDYLSQLENNNTHMLRFFNKERAVISANLKRKNSYLQALKSTGSITFVLLIAVLVYLGRRIRREFNCTVSQTKRIQADIDYRISTHRDEFSEFSVVYDAMNKMADTIKKQVNELEEARDQLSDQVKARTARLEYANQMLTYEIKEREKTEKQRIDLETRLNQAQKMEAIGTLAGGVAHDLNNILTGIVSYPDLILRTIEPDHTFRRPLEVIKSSGEKAAAIVQDLLTMARRNVNVSEVLDLRNIIKLYLSSPQFRKLKERHPQIRFLHQFNSELSTIKGSPVHLEKTVMNLVTNAVEALSDQGTVILSIENVYVDTIIKGYETIKEGDYIKLTVADNGVGIASHDLDRIFEPFFTKKQMGRSGTGLGMAVVWGTVKDHNGYVDIHSKEGEGTTFSLYFPISREILVVEKPDVDIEIAKGEGQRILIVDDVAEQREIAAQILLGLGYQAVSVASGDEAVRYVRDHSVDLMVLDMIMPPGMDGLDTYQEILSVRPGTRAIIASGFSETERVRKAQELGAYLYVRKPYTVEKIATAVKQALTAALPYTDIITPALDSGKHP
jgi:C4-dicarboxylate-specific signal transduction histidine kinase/CheY-like chemotaxis protein